MSFIRKLVPKDLLPSQAISFDILYHIMSPCKLSPLKSAASSQNRKEPLQPLNISVAQREFEYLKYSKNCVCCSRSARHGVCVKKKRLKQGINHLRKVNGRPHLPAHKLKT